MQKNGARCYFCSDGHPVRRLKWAFNSFLKAFVVGDVKMSVGRPFRMFTTLRGACLGTLGLMECQKYVLFSKESADSHDYDVLCKKS